jgi:hypothetical protein
MAVASVIKGVVELAGAVAQEVMSFQKNDNEKRERFTQQFVQDASGKYPGYNVVIVHPQHSASGAQVIHQHYELPMTVGTCGYEIYFSPKGKAFSFENKGDGGFINWAFAGEFNRNGGNLKAIEHA